MHRASISFLLNHQATVVDAPVSPATPSASSYQLSHLLHPCTHHQDTISTSPRYANHPHAFKLESAVQELISVELEHACLNKPMATAQPQRHKCKVGGCTTASVSKGLCVRHGGGTRCSEPGCTKRTKRFQRCYMHGGFLMCSEQGCGSKAKRFGRCWAHGGGVACSEAGCDKLSVKGRLCWTHGGGCRCDVDECGRRAYKRFGFRCQLHTACGAESAHRIA